MRLEFRDVARLFGSGHSAFDYPVDGAGYVTAEIYAALAFFGVGRMDHDARGAEVADYRLLFKMPAAEEAQHTARESFYHRPTEAEPYPAVAGVAQEREPQVCSRGLSVLFVPLVYAALYVNLIERLR